MTAKTRPVLVVGVECGDADPAIVTVAPPEIRQSPFETDQRLVFSGPVLFLVQGASTYPKAWAIRKLGALHPAQIQAVTDGLAAWLGIRKAENT